MSDEHALLERDFELRLQCITVLLLTKMNFSKKIEEVIIIFIYTPNIIKCC